MKVQDSDLGGSLSLADTLAKGVFGDPEAIMKAKLAAAQAQAHEAYATKLGADTGLVNVKTREEQALADAQTEAAAHPDALIAAVPQPAQPIPVEAPRANAPGTTGYGPQPGIVTPDAQATYDTGVKMHDAQVATLKAAWPAIVRSGNATQIIEALGKGEGLAALSGGLVPGAKPDPNVQRVAGGLYTGTAPSTGTVWSPGDTAGQQAEAGKDIAVKTAEGQLPVIKEDAGGFIKIDPKTSVATPIAGAAPKPLGGTDKGLRDQYYAELKAKRDQGQALSPTEQATLNAIEQERLKDTTVALDPEKPIARMKPDGSGVEVVPGQPEAKPPPVYQSKTDKADALNRIVAIQQKLAGGQTLTPQEADLYESDYNQAYGPTNTKTVDPGTGKPVSYSVRPAVPANTPSVNDVRKAAGLPLRAETSQDDQFTPRVTPEQDKARSFADAAAHAETRLSPMTPKDIPGPVQTWIVTQDDPSLLMSLAQTAQDPKTQQWAQTMWEFTNAINRKESGQAITAGEWKTARQLYIPMPGNDQDTLRLKHAARVLKIQDVANEGFRSDPKERANFDQRWRGQGANLDMDGGQTPNGKPPISSFFK